MTKTKPTQKCEARPLPCFRYYAVSLIDPLSTKACLSAIVTAFVAAMAWIGVPMTMIIPMLLLGATDLATGVVKAKIQGNFSSDRLRMFVPKWILYFCLLAGVGAFIRIIPNLEHVPVVCELLPTIKWLTVEFFMALICITELISTGENIVESKVFANHPLGPVIESMVAALKNLLKRNATDEDKP